MYLEQKLKQVRRERNLLLNKRDARQQKVSPKNTDIDSIELADFLEDPQVDNDPAPMPPVLPGIPPGIPINFSIKVRSYDDGHSIREINPFYIPRTKMLKYK